MTLRKTGAKLENSASAGFISPVLIPAYLVLIGVLILMILLPSNLARLTALGLLVSVGLAMLFRKILAIVRKGDEVEVTATGNLEGRRGVVVTVLDYASCYEVKLYESEAQGKKVPSDTAKLYWFQLSKVRSAWRGVKSPQA